MSRYTWPAAKGRDRAQRGGDDPRGRARFNASLRCGLGRDLEAALRASRAPTQPMARAVANTRAHLWQPLGPATLLAGQAESQPRMSGRVNAICVHPDGERAYAASANGGVWYTKDGGASWVSVAGLAATNTAGIKRPAQRNACGAIHVVFGAVEGEDTVFLGTGEVGNDIGSLPGDPEGGVGILVGTHPVKSVADDPWVREAPNLIGTGIYRIVQEPGGAGTVVAATRIGLFKRPAVGGADVAWERMDAAPFDSVDSACSDVLWTPSSGSTPKRLWVWVDSGDRHGLWALDELADEFVQVDLAAGATIAFAQGRAALAAPALPDVVWLLNDFGDDATSPGLFRISNPSTGFGAPSATPIVGVPNVLRDQGDYDIAIAVDPTDEHRLVLGGSWMKDTTPDGDQAQYNAAIVSAKVGADLGNGGALTYGRPDPYVLIGIGVHPDVHALAFSNGGARLWAACDGGVFRSDAPRNPIGFYACNQGLSIAESNYLAAHPACPGRLLAGLQDNGTVERLSGGCWKIVYKGDGGGVVFDALQPDRYLRQYTQGSWNFNPGPGRSPIFRAELTQAENKYAAFYSTPATIRHTRPAANPADPDVAFSQTLIGTHRLWYSQDQGVKWFTLKAGTDPLPASVAQGPIDDDEDQVTIDADQDSLGGAILVCRWQDPDTAYALTAAVLYRFSRAPGTNNATSPGSWSRQALLQKNEKNKDDFTDAEGPVRKAETWTELLPNPFVDGGNPVPALYLGTSGHPDDEDVDTLWWFDGTHTWFPTALRAAVPAPVLALAIDPALPAEVWVGTTIGVWHGARTRNGSDPPQWAWTQRVNGLPEAAVEDLQIFNDGTVRLLRAAIAARGVWELRLDTADLVDRTYLRVHDDDLRHHATCPLTARDGAATRSWHGSPDVRPRPASLAVAPPASLPWHAQNFPGGSTARGELRRFQAALRSSAVAAATISAPARRLRANGVWDVYFSGLLRELGAPTVAVGALTLPQITVDFWNAHMTGTHATAEPWGAGVPSEADLLEFTPELFEGDPAQASCTLPAAPCKVEVLVQHRGLAARAGSDVRVALLQWRSPDPANPAVATDTSTWFSGNVPWTADVTQVLNSVDGLPPAAPLTGGWSFVLAAGGAHRIALAGQTLDGFTAGVAASFDLDLTGLASGTVVLLAAVIRAGANVALVAQPLQQMVLGQSNVAVRSLQVA